MAKTTTEDRIKRLREHLQRENPVLANTVQSFQELDKVSRKLGFMDADDSYASHVSWWPVIAVLGTFSAGKSTYLNQYIGQKLQRTGNQAVDDKFTVMCYGADPQSTLLPGRALDSDPRFPFYQISDKIEEMAEGEGRGVDSYLQLKTSNAESLRGKIIIDSPGFDADQQRASTLLITDHIIDLSDLVLVFFDARHPEPGAMGDTLKHLVGNTVARPDAAKFLFILNQIDNTAREDNPEEVVAAWQRALAQHGLTAGRFYRIYSREAAVAIEDEQVKQRMEAKRDEDLGDIESRIHQVEVERAYRVVGTLEKTAKYLRDELVPRLSQYRRLWRRRTWWLNGVTFGVIIALFLIWSIGTGAWEGLTLTPFAQLSTLMQGVVAAVVLVAAVYLYMLMRRLAGRSVERAIRRDESLGKYREPLTRAFGFNRQAWWHSQASSRPRGWSKRMSRKVDSIIAEADRFVQALNDRYATPSGSQEQQKAGKDRT